MPDYRLDTDIFIESRKGPYGFDIAPGFWAVIEQKARDGVVASSTLVYDEICAGDDDLVEWVKARRALVFREPDPAVQHAYRLIAAYVVSNHDATAATVFLGGADPWLIAHAKAHGGAVVTRETRAIPGAGKVKIPNICQAFEVPVVDVYEMLRRLRVSLNWQAS